MKRVSKSWAGGIRCHLQMGNKTSLTNVSFKLTTVEPTKLLWFTDKKKTKEFPLYIQKIEHWNNNIPKQTTPPPQWSIINTHQFVQFYVINSFFFFDLEFVVSLTHPLFHWSSEILTWLGCSAIGDPHPRAGIVFCMRLSDSPSQKMRQSNL